MLCAFSCAASSPGATSAGSIPVCFMKTEGLKWAVLTLNIYTVDTRTVLGWVSCYVMLCYVFCICVYIMERGVQRIASLELMCCLLSFFLFSTGLHISWTNCGLKSTDGVVVLLKLARRHRGRC
jgi:hypothetical protein